MDTTERGMCTSCKFSHWRKANSPMCTKDSGKGNFKIDELDIDDSFFEIGGDSLSAINLCAQIQKEFNYFTN